MGHKRTSDLHADALDLENFGAAIIANTDTGGGNSEIPVINGVTFGSDDISALTTEDFNAGLTEGNGLHLLASLTDQTPNGTYISASWNLNNPSIAGTLYFGVTFANALAVPLNVLNVPYTLSATVPDLIKVTCQLFVAVIGGKVKTKVIFSGFSSIETSPAVAANDAMFTLSSTPLNIYAVAMGDAAGAGISAGSTKVSFVDLT